MVEQLHSSHVARRFSRAARGYEQAADFQRYLRHQLELIAAKYLVSAHRDVHVLDVGTGSGELCLSLKQRFPNHQFEAIDIATAMVTVAREHHRAAEPIVWHTGDFRQYEFSKSFDVLLSGAALHWMLPLTHTARRIAGLLSHDGMFFGSIMLKGTMREIVEARSKVCPHKKMPLELPSIEEFFQTWSGSGLEVLECRLLQTRYHFPTPRSVVTHLRRTGVNGQLLFNRANILTPREVRDVVSCLADGATHQGIPLSYRALLFAAKLVGDPPEPKV